MGGAHGELYPITQDPRVISLLWIWTLWPKKYESCTLWPSYFNVKCYLRILEMAHKKLLKDLIFFFLKFKWKAWPEKKMDWQTQCLLYMYGFVIKDVQKMSLTDKYRLNKMLLWNSCCPNAVVWTIINCTNVFIVLQSVMIYNQCQSLNQRSVVHVSILVWPLQCMLQLMLIHDFAKL